MACLKTLAQQSWVVHSRYGGFFGKNISKNGAKSCKREKGGAHGSTLYSHSSFELLGRQSIWASTCTTHQRSCCSQGMPSCRLQYAVKTQFAFYLDAMNTLLVFNPMVTICAFTIKYYYHVHIFSFHCCNPSLPRVAQLVKAQATCPNQEKDVSW